MGTRVCNRGYRWKNNGGHPLVEEQELAMVQHYHEGTHRWKNKGSPLRPCCTMVKPWKSSCRIMVQHTGCVGTAMFIVLGMVYNAWHSTI